MGSNGDNSDSDAYRSRCRFVTGRPICHGCGAADQTAREGEVVMPSATLNQDRADQDIPAPVPPRRRRTAMVVVSALVGLAVGSGAPAAMPTRRAPAVTAEPPATTAAGPAASAPA